MLIFSTHTQFYGIRKTVLEPFSDRPTVLLTPLSPTYTLTEKSLTMTILTFLKIFPKIHKLKEKKLTTIIIIMKNYNNLEVI